MTKQQLLENYAKQKSIFLDNLQPDDFRNGASFNQAEIIIDELNLALYGAVQKQKDAAEFITKAVTHLFRENSVAVPAAIKLSQLYLEMRLAN